MGFDVHFVMTGEVIYMGKLADTRVAHENGFTKCAARNRRGDYKSTLMSSPAPPLTLSPYLRAILQPHGHRVVEAGQVDGQDLLPTLPGGEYATESLAGLSSASLVLTQALPMGGSRGYWQTTVLWPREVGRTGDYSSATMSTLDDGEALRVLSCPHCRFKQPTSEQMEKGVPWK